MTTETGEDAMGSTRTTPSITRHLTQTMDGISTSQSSASLSGQPIATPTIRAGSTGPTSTESSCATWRGADIPENVSALGIADRDRVPDKRMTSSSSANNNVKARQGRLNSDTAWLAKNSDPSRWIQVDLATSRTVVGVATQGRHNVDQRVKFYKVSFSLDGDTFTTVRGSENPDEDMIFRANCDRDTTVFNRFPEPRARVLPGFCWYVMTGVTAHVLLTRGDSMRAATTKCHHGRDGYNLNYTIPMVRRCPVRLLNGQHVQLIPKLIPYSVRESSSCPRKRTSRLFPSGDRVCSVPDCLAKPCVNGFCEETMYNFTCHCPPGFGGSRCDIRLVATMSDMATDTGTMTTETGEDAMSSTRTTPSIPIHLTQTMDGISTGRSSASLSGQPIATPTIRAGSTGPTSSESSCATWRGADIPENVSALGIADRDRVPDERMTSSSRANNNVKALHGRLNSNTAWVAGKPDPSRWIQVDLATSRTVVGVATQGRHNVDQWVKFYKVSFSSDGDTFTSVRGSENPDEDMIFRANCDRNTAVFNSFPEPVVCRYVRVMPTEYHSCVLGQ
ncbi:uncharacterized protein [Diadema antillarum]|uniref:uncharacterized protein n=1 Tax=Diadema antillarum TaxID=105358 RepID=UPI003A84CD52